MRHAAIAFSLLLTALPRSAAARPEPVVSFADPADDATGTGTYLPPTSSDFRPGDFDLRRFAVRVDGDDALFEVTLGASIRRPEVTQRTNFQPLPLGNHIYLQNIDVYIDCDRTPGTGHAEALPGRRVTFAGTWEKAVVMTPQPGGARSVVESALGDGARDVLFPGPLDVNGRTVVARVPLAFLGGVPSPSWGWQVLISGASWERTFHVVDSLRGTADADVYTMPVKTVAEDWAFGGAPVGKVHPQVLDLLLPPSIDQARMLSGFDLDRGTFAQVPFLVAGEGAPRVSALPPPAPPPKPKPSPRDVALVVVDSSKDLLTATGPVTGVKTMQFGTVLDAVGKEIGRVVVVRVLDSGLVASVVEHKEPITVGSRLRFDEAGPTERP